MPTPSCARELQVCRAPLPLPLLQRCGEGAEAVDAAAAESELLACVHMLTAVVAVAVLWRCSASKSQHYWGVKFHKHREESAEKCAR